VSLIAIFVNILDGKIYTWGLGSAGQLGTGELLEELIPRSLNLPHKIVQIAAGVDHTLALSGSLHKVTIYGNLLTHLL